MAEKEVFHKNHPNTIIGHIRKRVGVAENFSEQLFILFVRGTISHGLSKIGTAGNTKILEVFLKTFDTAKASKSLHDILTEGRAVLPEVYTEYEITEGTLKGYEITEGRIGKFEGIIESMRTHYKQGKRNVASGNKNLPNIVEEKSLPHTGAGVVSPESGDQFERNQKEEDFRQSVQEFLESLSTMLFCNDTGNVKEYTIFSWENNTLIRNPKPINNSEYEPSVIYKRPIFYKIKGDTTRKEFYRRDLFAGLVTKEKELFAPKDIDINNNSTRKVVFNKSFPHTGIPDERQLSIMLRKLCKITGITYIKS